MTRSLAGQGRIIGALMMREIMTRFGRKGLGFLWLIGEPLLFCLGVIVLWTALKPAYEHGIRIGPFVMTGYMCLLLLRHCIQYSSGALIGNSGLLYHKKITVYHIFFARNVLEFAGATAAFIIVYTMLFLMGQVGVPSDVLKLYGGWLLLAWLSMGFAVTIAALGVEFEIMERLTPVMTYALIPLSGAFFMASVVPAQWRDLFLLIPFPNTIEMVRAGVFGEFVETHYSASYALMCGTVMNLIALILLARVKHHMDVE
ncbi:ABC transporter permease [Brevundimonas sp. DWP1b2]|uniref:ABC transporter permease n=1 Tax=Brevundimonas sp. DWP1b2 TaxID=2804659 RepID=UPI003CF92B5D